MTETEITNCPKCGSPFLMSQMFDHYNECKGVERDADRKSGSDVVIESGSVTQISVSPTIPIWPPQALPPFSAKAQEPIEYKEPQYLIKDVPIKPSFCKKCGTELVENDLFKICPKDKEIHIKMRMWWWIMLRYGLMIFWIAFGIGALTFASYYHSWFK